MDQPGGREQLKAILAEAAELTGEARAEYLSRACGPDTTLRAEVESLLAHLEATLAQAEAGGSSPTAQRGQRIGAYTIIEKLGEGGMGVVYKATQDSPRRTVALKIIKPHLASGSALERFRFETQVLAKLTHPGIAQIYAAGTLDTQAGEQPYFAMELVRGRPLLEHARLRNLTLRERLVLLRKIADAVHHAHTRGVVHRDLKPGNIFVNEEGEPKILDFGVARSVAGDLDSGANRTEIGQLIGTLPYMSPEQVGGDPDQLDARSDVYSLGVLLYELLSGALPYELERKLLHEAVRVIREVEPGRLSSVNRVYRGDVETIVGKALEKDRTRRYQSASELAADIDRYLRDEPITARPPSAVYQVRKFSKRHRVAAAGILVAASGITAGLVATSWQLAQTNAARKRESAANAATSAALAEATTQRDRARAALGELQGLTSALLEFESASRRLTGATAARRVLATTAGGVLERLEAVAGQEPWLRPALASASLRIGAVGVMERATLEQARDAYERAEAIYRQLLDGAQARPPGATDDPSRGLAESLIGLATVQTQLGGTQPALALSAEAFELAAVSGDGPLLVRAGRVRADALRRQGRLDEAAALLRKSLDEPWVAGEGFEPGEQRALLLADLGRVQDALGQNQQASESFASALALERSLLGSAPSDAVVRRRLLMVLYDAAERLEEQGRDAEALPLHQERLSIAQALSVDDPADGAAAEAVVTSLDAIGHALAELGDPDGAARSAAAFLLAARADAEAHPKDLSKQRRVALAHEFAADLSVAAARAGGDTAAAALESALASYQEAVATLRWIGRLDPARADVQQDIARLLLSIADAQRARLGVLGLSDDAILLRAFGDAADAFAQADRAGLLDEPSRRRWAVASRSLGTLLLNAGDGAGALAWFERAESVHPRRVAEDMGRMADACRLAGDVVQAAAYRQKALALVDEGRTLARGEQAVAALRSRIEAINPEP